MDLKNYRKMIRRIKRIFSVSLVMLCSLLLILEIAPVKVYAANYNASDFVSDVSVNGDTKTVIYEFGDPIVPYSIFLNENGTTIGDGYGSASHYVETDEGGYKISITTYHFGAKFFTSGSTTNGLVDIRDISDGAEITLDTSFRLEWSASVNPQGFPTVRYRNIICCYDEDFQQIDVYLPSYTVIAENTQETVFSIDNRVDYVVPSDAAYIACMTQFSIFSTAKTGTITFSVRPDTVKMSVDLNMIYEQSQTMSKIEQHLSDIGGQLDDTNEKLDDILTGGEAAEDLDAAGDQLVQAGDVVSDQAENISGDIDSVSDFESGIMSDINSSFDQIDVVSGFSSFGPSLVFVSGYVERIFEGMKDWQVALTLPLFLGLFFGICQHVGGVASLRARHARETRSEELHEARMQKIKGGDG